MCQNKYKFSEKWTDGQISVRRYVLFHSVQRLPLLSVTEWEKLDLSHKQLKNWESACWSNSQDTGQQAAEGQNQSREPEKASSAYQCWLVNFQVTGQEYPSHTPENPLVWAICCSTKSQRARGQLTPRFSGVELRRIKTGKEQNEWQWEWMDYSKVTGLCRDFP